MACAERYTSTAPPETSLNCTAPTARLARTPPNGPSVRLLASSGTKALDTASCHASNCSDGGSEPNVATVFTAPPRPCALSQSTYWQRSTSRHGICTMICPNARSELLALSVNDWKRLTDRSAQDGAEGSHAGVERRGCQTRWHPRRSRARAA